MSSENILRLIVIDDSSNDAETVSNLLRNAGNPVRTQRVEDDEDLREALKQQEWDMVLAKAEIPYFNATEVIGVLKQQSSDLPVIILGDNTSDTQLIELLNAGARDAVAIARPAHLIHAVLREVGDAAQRRQHKACSQQLEETIARAQTLVDSSRDAIAYVHEGMHIYANESYLNMFGYSDIAELEGMPIMNMVAKDCHGDFKTFLRGYLKGKAKQDEFELSGVKADGSEFKAIMEFSPAFYEGEPCIQIIIRDQSISKELEQKLDHLSKNDLLTGAYNRQFFVSALSQVVGKKGKQGAVLYIEPDKYREIRSEVGIGPSDNLLTELASALKEQLLGDKDIVARFEGHIFTILLNDISAEQAQQFAQKLVSSVHDKIFDIGPRTVTTTCSVGIGIYNETVPDPQDVISRAERGQADAHKAGGNTAVTYSPGEQDMQEKELLGVWSQRIRQALKTGNFVLLYQPVVSLTGDDTENYEVFLRMRGEDGEIIPPSEFLSAAEKTGLMTAVDRWVLAHSIKTLSERQRSGIKSNFFVKISGESLQDPKLLPWLRDLIKAAKLQPHSLTMEVSETVASHNLKSIKVFTNGLRQLHLRIALDHFGNAANYMNLLKHCEADFVKVSGDIIGKLGKDAEATEKLKEISVHAREHNRRVVAERVEDATTLAQVYGSGVDYLQGYFVHPPSEQLDFDFSQMG